MGVHLSVGLVGLAILVELKLNALAKVDCYHVGNLLEPQYKDKIVNITTRRDAKQELRVWRQFLALCEVIAGLKCNFRVTQVYVFKALGGIFASH